MKVDLRSDTVTRPTEEMRRVIAEAPVGDDVFGEDPSVNRLEEYVAHLLGKEAALYAPSGTMTNQIGVFVNTNRGEELLLHEKSHIFNYEAGAPAVLSGVQVRTLPGNRGTVDSETLLSAILPEDMHFPKTSLLCLENTHNAAGGTVFPLEEFAAVAGEAREAGLKVHLDGARLFNAEAAAGVPAARWCEHADTVSVCSSKGLGAPVGSLLAGDAETIAAARRVRKMFGGGMRQAGFVAAAALYAFENNRERLAEDHRRAEKLARGLAGAGYEVVWPETNILLVEENRPKKLLEALAREGVLATLGGRRRVRFCTHLDVTDAGLEAAVEAAQKVTASVAGR